MRTLFSDFLVLSNIQLPIKKYPNNMFYDVFRATCFLYNNYYCTIAEALCAGPKVFRWAGPFLCQNLRLRERMPCVIFFLLNTFSFSQECAPCAHICASSSAVYKLLATYTLEQRAHIYEGTHTHITFIYQGHGERGNNLSTKDTCARTITHYHHWVDWTDKCT